MNQHIMRQISVLSALLLMFVAFVACSDYDEQESVRVPGKASVTLHLLLPGQTSVVTSEEKDFVTRATDDNSGNDTAGSDTINGGGEPDLPDDPVVPDTVMPIQIDDSTKFEAKPVKLQKVWYVMADANNKVFDVHYSKLSDDNSSLYIENLQPGQYKIAILATTGDGSDVEITTPTELDNQNQWFKAKDGKPIFGNEYFYAERTISIGETQEGYNGNVTLERCLGQVEVDMSLNNIYLRRFLKSVKVTFDGNSSVSQTFYANNSNRYGGSLTMSGQNFDATIETTFLTMPTTTGGALSGKVEVLSTTSDSTEFTRTYRFSGLKVEAGKTAHIKVNYNHPEERDGEILVNEESYKYLPSLDTMFLSTENASIYYRMSNSARQWYVNKPLQVSINGKRLYIKLFAPKHVKNVDVYATFNNISSQRVKLAHFDDIYPFMEAYFDIPVTDHDCVYTTESGRRMEIPKIENFSSASVTLDVDDSQDPYMQKIHQIKNNNWQALFDHVSYSWSYEMTPWLCRNAVALVTNMAYMFSSDYFENEMKPILDAKRICAPSGDTTRAVTWATISAKTRSNRIWLRCGNCGGYGGMGSSAFYWLAPYCWTNHYYDKENMYSYSRQAIFHEFGHVLGYSHSDDMTYGNGLWWQTCAKIYVEMGQKGLLPVNNSSEVSDLPM